MPLNISTDRGQTCVDPATLPFGTVIKVYGSVPMPYKRALRALGAPSANVLNLVSAAGVTVGMLATASNIPAGATVTAISGLKVMLSASVTGPVSGAISFSRTAISSAATASGTNLAVPTAGLSVGMAIAGTGVDPAATVAAIVDGANLTMSVVTTGSIAAGATITFSRSVATSSATTTTSTSSLNLQVISTDPDGLLGNGALHAVGAVVYNEKMVSFSYLAHAVAHGWALVPMANIIPGAPTYL